MSSQNPTPITGLDYFQAKWGPYLDRVFPHSTPDSITEHLAREVAELVVAQDGKVADPTSARHFLILWHGIAGRAFLPPPETTREEAREAVMGEIGDCLLLLLHLSHRWGVSFHQALHNTALKVQARTEAGEWGEVDRDGVVEHKRGEEGG